MKAKRIAEITADIAKLKEQISQLSEELTSLSAELINEHGGERAAAMIAQAIVAREMVKGAKIYAKLSTIINAPDDNQAQEDEDKEYLITASLNNKTLQ